MAAFLVAWAASEGSSFSVRVLVSENFECYVLILFLSVSTILWDQSEQPVTKKSQELCVAVLSSCFLKHVAALRKCIDS